MLVGPTDNLRAYESNPSELLDPSIAQLAGLGMHKILLIYG